MVCLEVLDCCAVLKASKWGRRSSICAPRRPRICSLMHLILGHGMGIHVGDRYHEMFLVYYGEVYYVLYIQICDLNSHSFEFRANFNPFAFNTQYFRLCTWHRLSDLIWLVFTAPLQKEVAFSGLAAKSAWRGTWPPGGRRRGQTCCPWSTSCRRPRSETRGRAGLPRQSYRRRAAPSRGSAAARDADCKTATRTTGSSPCAQCRQTGPAPPTASENRYSKIRLRRRAPFQEKTT